MVFAHGPLGVLAALVLRTGDWWGLQTARRHWGVALAFFGGIIPDIDLLYVWFVDASRWHREYITATPFPYLLLFCIVGGLLLALKKQQAFRLLSVFAIANASHLVVDMIMGKVMLFYPFSSTFYGLTSFGWKWTYEYGFFVNFLLEGIFGVLFLYMLIVWYSRSNRARRLGTALLLVAFAGGLALLTQLHLHIERSPDGIGIGDWDGDGLLNFADGDMDGDGVLNIDDPDADGDGVANAAELLRSSDRFVGNWYDPTDGGFRQIPSRLGLLVNEDGPRRLYGTAGVFLKQAMVEDYARMPDRFVRSPQDTRFDRDPQNLRGWLQGRGVLREEEVYAQQMRIGDILFFEAGYIAVVVGIDGSAQPLVLDIHPQRPIQKQPLSAVVELHGHPNAVGSPLRGQGSGLVDQEEE